jgi:predicted metalloprotease
VPTLAERPAERGAERPAERGAERPAERGAERPAERGADCPEGCPTGYRITIIAAIVVAIVIGACGIESGDDPSGQPTSGATEDGRNGDNQINPDEFREDLEGAITLAEQYWTGRFQAAGRRFAPIRQVVPYTRDGEVACGGEPIPTDNAVYCPAGDFIAYDINFAVRAFERIGDAFLYYLLGHEYAHGIQVRLGIQYQFTIAQELQADCFAGAYIGDMIRAGPLELEPGDLDEFRAGLLAVGDDPSVPWFAPGAHGTAEQRATAFFKGYEESLAPCGLSP